MALNATIGDSGQNSYVTEEEATTYFGDRIHASAWDDFDGKEQVLITSSQMLDWYLSFKGTKTLPDQPMQWPRQNVLRPDGSPVSSAIIPNEIKVAVYELALSSLEEDRTSDDPLAGIEMVKAGPLSVKADSGDSDSTASPTIPEKVRKILSDLTTNSGIGVVRLMRA